MTSGPIIQTPPLIGWPIYFGNFKSFSDLTNVGGDFENEFMYAMSLIMKGLYYQTYTDTFGMVPFTEAGVENILQPKYDLQQDIYKGIIADLDQAIAIIGDTERTGIGVDDAAENDLYCGGDLQQWKQMANTLKLRIGMRALGAPGDDFALTTIQQALAGPLLGVDKGSVTMAKDLIVGQFSSASYGDIWNGFGEGSNWTVSAPLINRLRDNNDPRLAAYARPAIGGPFVFFNPEGEDDNEDYAERLEFIVSSLDAAGATYTRTTEEDRTTIEVAPGQFIGQPVRLNVDIFPFVRYNMFSTPNENLVPFRGQQIDSYPEIVMTSAESYFLQAEAAVMGLSDGDAQALFALGILEAMKLWEIAPAAAEAYVANEEYANISTGTQEEKLEKIAEQRWLASYTDGFEAWAIVRKTGYPTELAEGVSNQTIFALGSLNGKYPQRMRYGSSAQQNANFSAVEGIQGPDLQGTELWFAKN